MYLTKILSQREDIAWKEIEDQIVLMDLGPKKMVHRLNSVGSFIWKRLDGKNDLEAIKSALCSEYSITTELAENDLLEFIENMEKLGVIVGS
ncbi:MAG: hypothetical protein ACJAT2_001781 [Bacteriovoracaceae bacterium]|jgi:hypothetical protein